MKAIIRISLLMTFFICGCSNVSTYYYHPSKSLDQAEADWLKCHEGLINSTFKGTVIRKNYAIEYFEDQGAQCMTELGYIQVDEPDLPAGIRKHDSAIGHIYYSVAGR